VTARLSATALLASNCGWLHRIASGIWRWRSQWLLKQIVYVDDTPTAGNGRNNCQGRPASTAHTNQNNRGILLKIAADVALQRGWCRCVSGSGIDAGVHRGYDQLVYNSGHRSRVSYEFLRYSLNFANAKQEFHRPQDVWGVVQVHHHCSCL
jgi:hypothetical protein